MNFVEGSMADAGDINPWTETKTALVRPVAAQRLTVGGIFLGQEKDFVNVSCNKDSYYVMATGETACHGAGLFVPALSLHLKEIRSSSVHFGLYSSVPTPFRAPEFLSKYAMALRNALVRSMLEKGLLSPCTTTTLVRTTPPE
jgi:hypothetical protein